MKEGLFDKLQEWGIHNASNIIKHVEEKGSAQCGRHKILLVK
ncbi:hypothetical protein [Paenibacillus odorifer]|nr:hypothetical protein [Paenibacillus odorifer]